MRGMDPKTAIPAGMRPRTEFLIPSYFGCVAQPICNGLQGSVIIAGCLKPRAEVNDSFVLPCRVVSGLSDTYEFTESRNSYRSLGEKNWTVIIQGTPAAGGKERGKYYPQEALANPKTKCICSYVATEA